MDTKLLKLLYTLQDAAQRTPEGLPSICIYVQNEALKHESRVTAEALIAALEKVTRTWPMGNGSAVYPVPHPDFRNKTAYTRANIFGAMWLGEYGDNRKDLLHYVIQVLERRCNNGRLVC